MLKQDRQVAEPLHPPVAGAPPGRGAANPARQPAFTLGPFDPERGPFIFENASVFPAARSEAPMREPQASVYRVVNFDLLDEYGRNFVFSSQDVNDRTGGNHDRLLDGEVSESCPA